MQDLAVLARVVFDVAARSDRAALYADGELEVLGRRRARLRPGSTVSFAAYFNAFPAWHWHEFTDVSEVTLSVRLLGGGELRVLRSDAHGAAREVVGRVFDDGLDAEIPIDLAPNADGGWLWFDLLAGDSGLEVAGAEWGTRTARVPRPVTLAMTTMDKPEFALGVLHRLAEEPTTLAVLDEAIVIDQGMQKVAGHPGLAAVRDALGGRLRVIDQANLGGSGGFARGMIETLDAGRAGAVVLLDDDVELEPEAIARGAAFAAHTPIPTIVGGHFFDLHRPTRLHAFSEAVSSPLFNWAPVGPSRHDLAETPLREAAWLHGPAHADYNGWWCCLIPVEVLQDIGLALPAFLKWDDAEFGLRAAAAGYPTVSLPGMAIWHVSWDDKDNARNWQAFYHARNRLVAALVDARAPGRLLPARNLLSDVYYLLRRAYHVVELRHLAYRSVWSGPEGLHDELGTRLPEVLARMREFPSAAPGPHRAEWGTTLRMGLRAVGDWSRMQVRWTALGRRYRRALPQLVAAETWRSTLGR